MRILMIVAITMAEAAVLVTVARASILRPRPATRGCVEFG